jgi:hypothetical protein
VTEEEVKTRLELLVLTDEDPELSADQLNDLVALARRPDPEGLVYGEDNWTPSWDLSAAAAEGWRRKAGLAAARFDFAEDGQTFQRAQIYAHCISQAAEYARKGMGAIPVSGST